mgnify:CR=1 FL=1
MTSTIAVLPVSFSPTNTLSPSLKHTSTPGSAYSKDSPTLEKRRKFQIRNFDKYISLNNYIVGIYPSRFQFFHNIA